MPEKPKAKIVPATALVGLRLGEMFDLRVGNKRREFVKWRLKDPQTGLPSAVGTMSHNYFAATKEPRQSYAILEGETDDKKHKAEARIHIRIDWERASPAIVDDWSVAVLAQGAPWNTGRGRRAWLLMMDILHQLPGKFLDELGMLYIARVPGIFFGQSFAAHWPFDRRAILMSDEYIGPLQPHDPAINRFDREFAMTFFHELAHVILANRAFGGDNRFLPSIISLAGRWISVPVDYITYPLQIVLSPLQFLIPGLAGRKPQRDFLSDYADATGWVINAISRQNFFLSTLGTESPDVLTGHRFFGRSPTIHLRNNRLPDKYNENDLRKAGFPAYDFKNSPLDVHEDFADSLAYLAFFPEFQREKEVPAFKSRAEFFHTQGIWPRGKVIEVGGYLNRWAEQRRQRNPKFPLPDTSRWAVNFGPYAGKATGNDPYANNPSPQTVRAFSAKSSGVERAGGVESNEPVDDDAESLILAEGEGRKSPLFDEVPEIIREKEALLEYHAHSEKYQEEVEPFIEQARLLFSEMELPPRDASPIEWLRTAELHGEGVTYYPPDKSNEITGRAPGDLCLDKEGNLWMILAVDAEGRITRITGAMSEPDNLKKFAVTWLRYVWRPEKRARKWKVAPGAANYRGDISDAMTYLIRLWGELVSPAARDLSRPASLLAEALDRAGIVLSELKKKGWWNSWSLEDVENFCNQHGDGTQPFRDGLTATVGDIMRLRQPDRIGVVTRVSEQGEPLNLLVNGGDDTGEVCEEVDAAKMLHNVDLKKVVWLWHPNGKARQPVQ